MSGGVLIVDDHPMIRSAVTGLLAGGEFAITATAGSARAAIAAIAESDPALVILDLAMPGGSGLQVLRDLRAAADTRPVVVLSAAIADDQLAELERLHVDGIVLKNSDPANLLDCIAAVATGKRWIDPEIEARLAGLTPATPLSPRERQLVALVAKGLRNREIAARLGVTEGTVKVYLHAIFDKLGVASRTELAMRATQGNLGG